MCVSINVCTHAPVHACMYMYTHIHTQIHNRPEINLLFLMCHLPCFTVCLSIISLALNLPTKARLVASELQESASLHLPIAGILSICRMSVFFCAL